MKLLPRPQDGEIDIEFADNNGDDSYNYIIHYFVTDAIFFSDLKTTGRMPHPAGMSLDPYIGDDGTFRRGGFRMLEERAGGAIAERGLEPRVSGSTVSYRPITLLQGFHFEFPPEVGFGGGALYRAGDRNLLTIGLDLSNPRQFGAWFCDENGNNNGTRLEVRYYTVE